MSRFPLKIIHYTENQEDLKPCEINDNVDIIQLLALSDKDFKAAFV